MRSSTPLFRLAKYALLGLVGVCFVFFTGMHFCTDAGSAVATGVSSRLPSTGFAPNPSEPIATSSGHLPPPPYPPP
ncbi:MAG: hypothetical protein V9H26_14495 [Verrucomicrobiota bacterium]